MSQFGPKNPAAWARPPGANQQLNAGLFQNPLIGAQPFAQMGMINAAAFSQQAVGNMGMNLGMLQTPSQTIRMQAQQQQKNRTFSGVVTKMHDNYGFIDDDVFFQVSNVRGALPRTGDRVMVEASYNPTMPFKWNAYRVQLIGDKSGPGGGGLPTHTPPDRGRQPITGRGMIPGEQSWAGKTLEKPQAVTHINDSRSRDFRASPRPRSPIGPGRHRSPRGGQCGPPALVQDMRRLSSPRRISPPRGLARRSPRRSPARDYSKGQMGRISPKHSTPVRKHEGKREHSASVSGRNRSPSQKHDPSTHDSLSPPRRRSRIIPRYQCYVPKPPILNGTRQTVMQLRKRYPLLYIPSDFSDINIEWPKTTPIENPISISTAPITYHILHKDIDCPSENLHALNPPDADCRFSVKIVLMSHQGLSLVHQKAFGLLVDGSIDENVDSVSLKRCLNFVVGTRNKEMMAIGGAWSPSLDGDNPETDPQVFVRTAIRTVRALIGVDLSRCPRWYKMAEIRYYRAEKDRMDTCCLFLPDTSGLMPTEDCYQQLLATLKDQLGNKLAAVDAQKLVLPSTVAVTATDCGDAGEGATVTTEPMAPAGDTQQQLQQGQQQSDVNKEQVQEVEEEDDEDLNPTHWSKLDIRTMKVAELRQELMARDLETKGVKSVLCARLQEALDQEKTKDEDKEDVCLKTAVGMIEVAKPQEENEEKELTDEDKKAVEKFEKEKKEKKASLERHFTIPKEPGILVYPNRMAKGGKFDCKIVSLHTMLDYRIEDNKEHSFELAVMAECISEMLDRSQAFIAYKTLSCAIDKESEKKRREEAKLAEIIGVEEGMESVKTDKAEKSEEEKKENEKKEEEQRKFLAEARKPIVIDRTVFQAFAHFDQNLCGYILEKDFEEILFSIGLNISRAQVQKLLKRYLSRDRISYRYLTDSWANKDGTVTYRPGVISDPPTTEQLAKGNILKESIDASKKTTSEAPDISATGSVIYLGSLMNIPQVLEQVSKMESDSNAALQKVDVLEAQLKDGAKHVQVLEKKKKRLEEDVEKYRKRLHDAEKCLKNSVDDTVQMKSAIQEFRRIGERMIGMAEKLMPNPKEEEKTSEKDEKDVKKEKKDDKDDKKVPKKKDSAPTKVNGEAEEKKELQLVDEVGGNDVGDEPMESDVIVLSEEVTGDEEKDVKKEILSSQKTDSTTENVESDIVTSLTHILKGCDGMYIMLWLYLGHREIILDRYWNLLRIRITERGM
uniref:BMA-LST-3, isoform f n=1 Tax=Brugia malayi TaxID=6279 RepID=A0A1I9G648_BRUMA|nr:BMA-LST-3, isoform f [Brugia malayi]